MQRHRFNRGPTGECIVQHRGGFNLAELLFVVSAISALSILAMTVVGLLISAEQHSSEELWLDVTIGNLATDLRADAHRAAGVTIADDNASQPATIQLDLPDGVVISYECTSDSVVRREHLHDTLQATDTYRLPFGSSHFAPPDESGRLEWVHVRDIPSIGALSQPSTSDAGVKQQYQILASVGLHTFLAGENP